MMTTTDKSAQPTWTTDYGEEIPIVHLSDRHLANALRYVSRCAADDLSRALLRPPTEAEVDERVAATWPALVGEAKRRGMEGV